MIVPTFLPAKPVDISAGCLVACHYFARCIVWNLDLGRRHHPCRQAIALNGEKLE
jgi:hypothetical protein